MGSGAPAPAESAQVESGAVAPGPEASPGPDRFAGLERIVVFAMEGQRYGLPIDVVQEIQQIVAFSEIPDESDAVVGVINDAELIR